MPKTVYECVLQRSSRGLYPGSLDSALVMLGTFSALVLHLSASFWFFSVFLTQHLLWYVVHLVVQVSSRFSD